MRIVRRDRSPEATGRGRAARQDPSVVEQVAWQLLRGNKTGFKFRREVEIDGYRMDFYCAEARLCVEFDGEQHDAAHDALRDQLLAEKGIATMRIPNTTVFVLDDQTRGGDWLSEIVAECERRAKRKAF